MSKFDYNKRDVYHCIGEEVRKLEKQFGLALIELIMLDLEDKFEQHQITNGIDDLINNNVIKVVNNKYLRSCY